MWEARDGKGGNPSLFKCTKPGTRSGTRSAHPEILRESGCSQVLLGDKALPLRERRGIRPAALPLPARSPAHRRRLARRFAMSTVKDVLARKTTAHVYTMRCG